MSKEFKIVLLIAAVLFSCWFVFVKSTAQWYDYGNGLVNLDRVTIFRHNMEITLKYPNPDYPDYEEDYKLITSKPITFENKLEVESKLREFYLEHPSGWTSITWISQLQFDQFTVQLPGFDHYYISPTDEGIINLVDSWIEEVSRVKNQIQ